MNAAPAAKIVVYTAIFGDRDVLLEPEYVPDNVDFVCFTDQSFTSPVWSVRHVTPPLPGDGTRNNRYYKILAHECLSEYEYSIYIDGNIIVTGDVTELLPTYLGETNFAALDCGHYSTLPSHSVADQVNRLLAPGQEQRNNISYDEIVAQAAAYTAEGFPDNNGCIMGMLLVRRHNESDVVAAMKGWWHEVTTRSKRDLMSFNYVAWKQAFAFTYIPLDGASNPYVKKVRHHQTSWQRWQFRLQGWWKKLMFKR